MANHRNILICAGGTGGHLFPAQALARELSAKGWQIHLVTDARAERFTADFPARDIHIINAATFSGRNPLKLIRALFTLGRGYRQSRVLVARLNPAAVIGFGGYPTLPPVMAGAAARVPVILHEQNAVMGRANRLLSKKANAIAMGFGAGASRDNPKFINLGNPVREQVMSAIGPYKKRKPSEPFQLLVFGGSQGAQFFAKILPASIRLLSEKSRDKLRLVQQVRPEDEPQLMKELLELDVKFEVATFFSPMAPRIAKADFVVCRAGASTVSELAVLGRPSLLVPYPFALDHDQAMNAAQLKNAGGCKVMEQKDISAEVLAGELENAINNPKALAQMAKNAKKTGKPNAAEHMAQLVEHIIDGKSALQFLEETHA